jgi:hypothetical protein
MQYSILRLVNDHPFPIKNYGPFTRFIDFECDYSNFAIVSPTKEASEWQMLSKCKLYDTIDGFGHTKGFALSDKFRTILSHFKMPLHRYYKVQVTHKQKIYDNYSWLHLLHLPENPSPINFAMSQFFPPNSHWSTNQPVSVTDFDDAAEKNVFLLDSSKIGLTKLVLNYDILSFRGLCHHCIISQPLKFALLEANISGIQIIEAPIHVET